MQLCSAAGQEAGRLAKIPIHMGGCQNYGPFLVPIIIRHLMFRVPKKDHNFDNHPYLGGGQFKVELEPQGKVSEKLSQPPKSQ